MQYWSYIQSLLLNISGRSDLSSIIVTNCTCGSVVVSSSISPAPNENPGTVYSGISSNVNSLSSSNFKVVSATSTANGFTPPSASQNSINLGVVLGVSLPLLVFGSCLLM
jgi:hypothetical protein